MVQKSQFELVNYTVMLDDVIIVPVEMSYDEKKCTVTFMVTNQRNFTRRVVRSGPHKNYVFHTKIWKTPFTVNLKTNVIKRERSLSQY